MNSTNSKAFTLAELIVVIVILAALAGYAIPRYTKSINQSIYADVMLQLKAIHAANKIRFIRVGEYWPKGLTGQDLTAINTNLGLSIIQSNNVVYTCDGVADGSSYTCKTTLNGLFFLQVTEQNLSTDNPGNGAAT